MVDILIKIFPIHVTLHSTLMIETNIVGMIVCELYNNEKSIVIRYYINLREKEFSYALYLLKDVVL